MVCVCSSRAVAEFVSHCSTFTREKNSLHPRIAHEALATLGILVDVVLLEVAHASGRRKPGTWELDSDGRCMEL